MKDSCYKIMLGKTRNEIYENPIGREAQTLPAIITLSFKHSIRKAKKALNISK